MIGLGGYKTRVLQNVTSSKRELCFDKATEITSVLDEIWCHFETIFGVRDNLRFGRNLVQIDPRDKI